MNRLEVNQLDIAYGNKQVAFEVSFQLGAGRIGCLLGPSGCGKTTVLRAIAGFERPSKGEVVINEKTVSDDQTFLPPERRNIGMVFQDFALFPHLSVADNIRFGIRDWPKNRQLDRLNDLLTMIGMEEYAKEYPHQLSGGQQQRIALVRAMAPRPDVLLMDEPFSSLDVELREQLAREVRQILKQENVSAILVTHNQNEAFAVGDDICVMYQGRIQQNDSAYNLYYHPANRFVADFVGEGTLLPGVVQDLDTIKTELGEIRGLVPKGCEPNSRVDVLVRPDNIVLNDQAEYQASIIDQTFRGSSCLYTLKTPGGMEVLSLVPSHYNHQINDLIGIQLTFDHLAVFN